MIWQLPVLVLLVAFPGTAAAARFAVVVGVGAYEDPAIPGVPHAPADAEAVRDWLTTVGGVPEAHVRLLLDRGAPTLADAEAGQPIVATRSNVLEALATWLPAAAGPEDTVFFYFAGQATTDAAGRGVILPGDARGSLPRDTGIPVSRLVGGLPGTPIVWLDTAFAGRGAPVHPVPVGADPLAELAAPAGLVWLAAGRGVAEEADGQPHGAFTDALLDALRTTDGALERTWVQLEQGLRGRPAPWAASGLAPGFRLADPARAVAHSPRIVPQAGHGSAVRALAWHPSRSWLASADRTGIVQLADVDTAEIRLRFASGRRGVRDLEFSEDGELLYVVGADGVARAWATADGTLRWAHPFSALDRLEAVAPSADRVAVGTTRGRIAVLDRATGDLSARWRIGPSPGRLGPTVTRDLAWSPSGDALASAGLSGELSMWFLRRGGPSKFVHQRTLRRVGAPLHVVAWSADGEHLLTGGADGTVEVYAADGGEPVAILPSNGFAVSAVAIRPGAAEAAVVADDIRLWTPGDDAPRRVLAASTRATAVAWAPDGSRLVTGHVDGRLRLWDAETGDRLGELPGQRSAVEAIDVHSPAALLAVVGQAGAHVWDLAEGRLVQHLPGVDGAIYDAAFTDTGDELITGGADGTVRWWAPRTGAALGVLGTDAAVRSLARHGTGLLAGTDTSVLVVGPDRAIERRWAVDGGAQRVALCDPALGVAVQSDDRVRIVALADGSPVSPRRHATALACVEHDLAVGLRGGGVGRLGGRRLRPRVREHLGGLGGLGDPAGVILGERRVTDLGLHPSEPWLVAGAEGEPTRVFDLERTRLRLQLDTYGARAVGFHAPGGLVITGSTDGTVQLWDDDTGARLATAVALGSEWLVWTPDGLFDGSPDGRRDLFRWRIGETLHTPSRFTRGYYRPQLLAELARGERPRAVRDIAALAPPPQVRIVAPAQGDVVSDGVVDVRVTLDDQGGGVAEPRLYVNGHRVHGGRGIERLDAPGPSLPEISFRVELIEGPNFLRATAFNGDSSWEALGDEITVTWAAPVTQAPRLHVLSVGIDAYRNGRLDLDFARDDAEAVAAFFDPGLFAEVVPHVLVDGDATLENVRQALSDIAARAAPRDALLVYLAGHGLLGGEVFYFLPWDVDVADEEALATTGLSQAELGEALARIPAAKQLVILDACQSGAAAVGTLTAVASRSAPGLIRAQQRLADSTGAFLIAASTDQQVAHEIPELGHGVLTYAILEALGRGAPPAANLDRNGHVTVIGLIQYVTEEVPRLTDRFHRQRQEVVQAASGQDFALVAP